MDVDGKTDRQASPHKEEDIQSVKAVNNGRANWIDTVQLAPTSRQKEGKIQTLTYEEEEDVQLKLNRERQMDRKGGEI